MADKEVPTLTGQLYDQGGREGTLNVTVKFENGFLHLYPEGYGEPEAAKGHGSPVFLELYKGRLRAVITPDILEDNSRKIVSLEKAREGRVTDWGE